ncbi:MAG: DNA repair protein RecN [Alistipes sp.]|nr:DNA repair protein RecN [Alistipes sp.]MBQ7311938.1 DNA repair protein RecN [Alistipes sp.]
MLTRLSVDNYALIDHLEVEFDSRLNIITGQTGAGKSILLGALSLLLGARNEGAVIKDNSRNCVVEAEFDIEKLQLEALFSELDLDYEPQIVIRRIITPAGKSRAFIGDMPVQLTTLKTLGEYLIDIHSQHRNLILASEQFRLEALDTIAHCTTLRSEFSSAYAEYNRVQGALTKAKQSIASARKEEEYIRYQVEELRAAALRSGEEAELEAELATLTNVESITEAYGAMHQSLTDEQTGVIQQLVHNAKALKAVAAHYADAAVAAERLNSVIIELQDLDSSAENTLEKVESDPERLDYVGARLELLYNLRRKHRAESIDQLIEIYNNYAAQLESIESADSNIAQLEQDVAAALNRATEIATQIYEAHKAAAPDFESQVDQILHKVGMSSAQLRIGITTGELTATGIEHIDFLFTANEGIAPRAIEKIASGGEMSRVMLALKAILSRTVNLPTIIFDEIDTGVSGSVANAVGEVIATLSSTMQVIDITHLPQVASKGNSHYLVYKSDSTTNMRALTAEERVVEIAKMLSGDSITDAAIAQAKILLGTK